MSDVFKFVAAGTAIVIVGAIVIALSGQSPEEKGQEMYLLGVGAFNKDARNSCANAVKQHLNMELGSPSDSKGDGQTHATLTWKIDRQGTSKTIVCMFEKEKGVTQLSMDGEGVSLK